MEPIHWVPAESEAAIDRRRSERYWTAMAVDPKSVGAETRLFTLRYDHDTLILYALGVGATRDELDYVYEARGPKVLPTFGVVPAYPVLSELLARAGASLDKVVHGAQSVIVHADLPPAGELATRGAITGVYDLKRMTQLVFRAQSSLDGQLIFETEWSLIVLGEGGFDGPRPPKSPIGKIPSGAEPAFVVEERIPPEQALLYRLSGDKNPLHADPAVASMFGFEKGPILHGLATYGYAARALIRSAFGGDASGLRKFHGQFRKPVWPGDTLRTEGFEVDGQYVLRSSTGSDDAVALFAAERAAPKS
jgi:acyl dehydratase